MNKKIYIFCLVVVLAGYFSFARALTKPSPDADMENLSYVFYLFYDNGQLFADRDYEIKYDVVTGKYIDPSPLPGNFKGEIITLKSTVGQTFNFDPKQGNIAFMTGKLEVRAPYVPDAQQVKFYNSQGDPVLNIFVEAASICNDDGICTAAEGENVKTCINDCKQARSTPGAAPLPSVDEGFDMTAILTYVVGGLAVLMGAWFGWKWWKKKRGESFLPPPSASIGGGESSSPSSLFPPPPPPLS